jgi:hypothetical protein
MSLGYCTMTIDGRWKHAHDSIMQTIQPVKRGGRRKGAGRPKGSGRLASQLFLFACR